MLTHAPQTTQGQTGQPSFFYPENLTIPGSERVQDLDPLPLSNLLTYLDFLERAGTRFCLARPGRKKKKNKSKLKQAQELLSGNCWRWGVTVFMEERAAFCFLL